jgi:hypothetical protein
MKEDLYRILINFRIKDKIMKTVMSFVFVLAVLIIPCGLFAQQKTVSTVTTTENAGTISEVSPHSIVVRSETSSSPMSYSYTKSTTYVDETGAPVSVEMVKSGLPVTVYYTREGDRMIADKVVVRKTTTTTGMPMVEEEHSSSSSSTTGRSGTVVKRSSSSSSTTNGLNDIEKKQSSTTSTTTESN